MRFRWLALFPLLYAAAFIAGAAWLLGGEGLAPFVYWQRILVRVLGSAARLDQERHGVHAEPGDAELQVEAHAPAHFREHVRVGHERVHGSGMRGAGRARGPETTKARANPVEAPAESSTSTTTVPDSRMPSRSASGSAGRSTRPGRSHPPPV